MNDRSFLRLTGTGIAMLASVPVIGLLGVALGGDWIIIGLRAAVVVGTAGFVMVIGGVLVSA